MGWISVVFAHKVIAVASSGGVGGEALRGRLLRSAAKRFHPSTRTERVERQNGAEESPAAQRGRTQKGAR